MTLQRLKSARILLLEDSLNANTIPLLLELAPQDNSTLHFFCYGHPDTLWKNVFKRKFNVKYHEEFKVDMESSESEYVDEKCSIIIDSIDQMSQSFGWNQCLKALKKLYESSNVNKLILILHTDCLLSTSKLRINLNHISNAIITYDKFKPSKVNVIVKKSGKMIRSVENLVYDKLSSSLMLVPVVKDNISNDEPEKLSPENLTTFKIEVDQTDKLEKYKLKLPYMSKIHDGESKIFYEPDAVDDWDEEDPDDDLDI